MFYKNPLIFGKMLETMNDVQIARAHCIPVRRICWWRNKLGLRKSPVVSARNTKYTLNRGFFSTIDTEEKAYALGFIASDGCVHGNLRNVAIAISKIDIDVLEKIRTAIGSNAPILKKRSRYEGINKKEQVVFNISSKEIVRDLISLGVTPKKSLTIRYPNNLNGMDSHFIRGVVDGDGHIGKKQCTIVGSEFLMSGIRDVILRESGCLWRIRKIRNSFRLDASRRDRDSLLWIYKGASIYLDRKYKNFITYWN